MNKSYLNTVNNDRTAPGEGRGNDVGEMEETVNNDRKNTGDPQDHIQNNEKLHNSIIANTTKANKLKQQLLKVPASDKTTALTASASSIAPHEDDILRYKHDLSKEKSKRKQGIISWKIAEKYMMYKDNNSAVEHLEAAKKNCGRSSDKLLTALIAYCKNDWESLKKMYENSKKSRWHNKGDDKILYLWEHHTEEFGFIMGGFKKLHKDKEIRESILVSASSRIKKSSSRW